MKIKTTLSIALLMSASVSINAQASYSAISLAGYQNADITTWSDGPAYNGLFTGPTTLSGVPFALSTDANKNNVIHDPDSVTLYTNIYGASTVYTLINSAYGYSGTNIGSLTFNASNGDFYTVQLVEGVNVRDHYYGYYTNTLTDTSVAQSVFGANSFGHAHLDMQQFVLPVSFASETLTSIVFVSNHAGTGGQPFLAGVTVSSVPVPAAVWLFGSALFGVLGLNRRRA